MKAKSMIELTQAEHALLLKLLKRHCKWFHAYGEVAPQYVDLEERDLTIELSKRLGEMEGEA